MPAKKNMSRIEKLLKDLSSMENLEEVKLKWKLREEARKIRIRNNRVWGTIRKGWTRDIARLMDLGKLKEIIHDMEDELNERRTLVNNCPRWLADSSLLYAGRVYINAPNSNPEL